MNQQYTITSFTPSEKVIHAIKQFAHTFRLTNKDTQNASDDSK